MQKLAEHIYLVHPPAKAVFPYSNSLYIDGSLQLFIDAGGGKTASAPFIHKVEVILISHYHFDHINSVELFPKAQIMAGAEELWAYNDEERYFQSSGYDIWEDLMGSPRTTSLSQRVEALDDIPVKPGFRNISINGCFRDGDIFECGSTRIMAVHTPGHTPGHYAFFFPDEGILFGGDLDLSPWGPWYGAFLSDFDDIVQSIERLIALEPRIFVSSHRGRIFTGDISTQLRNFLQIPLQKEALILEFLSKPKRLSEILNQDFVDIYPARTEYQVFWNRMMIKKHLDRLVKLDYIVNDEECYYARKG